MSLRGGSHSMAAAQQTHAGSATQCVRDKIVRITVSRSLRANYRLNATKDVTILAVA
jgi:DNA-binding transcriptional regulator/RsmH inhibitor MraZ